MKFDELLKGGTNRYLDIVDILQRISTKRKSENLPTIYGEPFKIAFVLIGRPEVVQRYGATPYIAHIEKLAREDIKRVYILAKGTYNVLIAEETLEKVKKRYRKVDRFPPTSAKANAVCFCLEK